MEPMKPLPVRDTRTVWQPREVSPDQAGCRVAPPRKLDASSQIEPRSSRLPYSVTLSNDTLVAIPMTTIAGGLIFAMLGATSVSGMFTFAVVYGFFGGACACNNTYDLTCSR